MIIKIVIVVVALLLGGVVAGILDQNQQTTSQHRAFGTYEKYFKQLIDFILSGMALIVLFPLMIVTELLV